jgi:ribonuclease HI
LPVLGYGSALVSYSTRIPQRRSRVFLVTHEASKKPCVTVYTDGSCLKNPGGAGGYAAVFLCGEKVGQLSGSDPSTTNNRMEIMAAILALESLPVSCSVSLYTDSLLVVNTMTLGWRKKTNLDLWERLDAASVRHEVSWNWIKGHAGIPLNELADELAGQAARSLKP